MKRKRQTHQTSTYQTWTQMKQRCKNPALKNFKNYGGRGITVCERWQSFKNFLADMGERPEGLQLERKNNDLGYSPENCAWVDRRAQNNNTRANHLITFQGVTQTVAQWARQVNLSYKTLYGRLLVGWPVDRALTTPTGPQRGVGKVTL